ncbi:hypothetical protein J6590_007380 [Homalodisca vitripennis]|nr:hypothetical protein J6590_007380 [Homalodisca vitripennis]
MREVTGELTSFPPFKYFYISPHGISQEVMLTCSLIHPEYHVNGPYRSYSKCAVLKGELSYFKLIRPSVRSRSLNKHTADSLYWLIDYKQTDRTGSGTVGRTDCYHLTYSSADRSERPSSPFGRVAHTCLPSRVGSIRLFNSMLLPPRHRGDTPVRPLSWTLLELTNILLEHQIKRLGKLDSKAMQNIYGHLDRTSHEVLKRLFVLCEYSARNKETPNSLFSSLDKTNGIKSKLSVYLSSVPAQNQEHYTIHVTRTREV